MNIKSGLVCLIASLFLTSCSVQGPKGEQGETGNGIISIVKTDNDGLIDTYTITYTDGTTSTFTVTNGSDGLQGIQGEKGEDGHTPVITIGENGNWYIDGVDTNIRAEGIQGETGNGIVSIEKASSNGLVDTYTITFTDGTTTTFTVTNGEDGVDGIQGEKGEDGHTPVITIGENGNWYIDGVDTNIRAEAITPPHYGETFSVYFNTNGGNLPSDYDSYQIVNWGDTLDLPIPSKFGYDFIGWYTGEGPNDKKFTSYDAVFRDLDLYAKYEVGTYNITLDLDGGLYEGDTKIEVKYGENYKLPSNITKKGYDFIGWYLDDQLIPNEGRYEYEDITLIAKYEVSKEYTINLNLNGGTFVGSTEIIVEAGENYTLPIDVTKDNLVFAGWYLGEERFEFEGTYKLKEDIWLAAKWVEKETYNLTLDLNGGNISSSTILQITNEDIYHGYKFELPTKSGYKFYSYEFENKILVNEEGLFNVEYAISILSENKTCTLKAKYIGDNLSTLGDYLYFGKYPQAKIDDEYLISNLEMANDTDGDGYLEYKNQEYKVEEGNYSNNYQETYFLVEPILWQVNSDGLLFSKYILDQMKFNYTSDKRLLEGNTIHGNNYEYSTIRAFLNGYDGTKYGVENYTNKGFYDIAFSSEEKALIQKSLVDNSLASTNDSSNKYICNDTNDYLWLLSVKDVKNADYGFTDSDSRQKQVTDYARFAGVYFDNYNNGYWWLRSPSPDDYRETDVRCISKEGSVVSYYVEYSYEGVVPALRLSI